MQIPHNLDSHEGHLVEDHVNMFVSIPPKFAVSQVIGCLKGKSAIHIVRVYTGQKRHYQGQHFWVRGFPVSTVGRDEEVMRKYIKEHIQEDRRLDQLQMFG